MYRFSPQELMLQLFSLQRRRTSPEHSGENSSADLELILTLDANNDDSSGEEADDDNSSQGDFVF
ncbi:hypothetical protein RchiOBHm_Chr6g0279061 [Rosa chinensis]|uniref:Uncharacterized protein n=2 Tax=Rosa chinensis TaxID=74649 RepID=A0A2P6PSZ6_ROSCH|nr:hypothetical protein RchiOBHm_Chr6g0279061 [Rosa chinensis]